MLAMLLPVCVFASDAVTERPFYAPDVWIAGFRAVAETDGAAGLRWTTGREFGAGVFVVRRLRLDGVEQRSEIGTVRMRGDEEGGRTPAPTPARAKAPSPAMRWRSRPAAAANGSSPNGRASLTG